MATKTESKLAAAATGEELPAKKSRKKLIIIIAVVVLLAVGGGVYKFLLSGSGAPPAPKPGLVVKLDPIQLNLAGGHYLKLGLALQATTTAGEELDGSEALDIAISLLSDRNMAALATGEQREKVKKTLVKKVSEAYEDEVMDVYFTEFVMQ